MQTKQKATLALLISALGAVGTFHGASGSFGVGLAHHGFLAATIGGLADWFAVTALFRKPLGISYRTEILRRNRVRIMDSLVEFTSEDLLSIRNIMSVLEKEDTAALLVDYLIHRGGREHIRHLVDELLLKAVNSMDARKAAQSVSTAVRKGLSDFAFERVFVDLLQLLAEEKHSRQVLASLLGMGQQVLYAPAMQQALLENIRLLRQAYEKDSFGRAFILSALDLTDENIRQIFNERLSAQLQELLSGDTESYEKLKASFGVFLRSAASDPSLAEMFRGWREHYLEQMDVGEYLETWINQHVKGSHPFWLEHLNHFVDSRIDEFVADREMQEKCDRFIKEFLESELKKHHALIPKLIRERLDEFDDDRLTEFVESRVDNDLQMIRINGSIVGAFVGMLLYLAVWIAERMWGI